MSGVRAIVTPPSWSRAVRPSGAPQSRLDRPEKRQRVSAMSASRQELIADLRRAADKVSSAMRRHESAVHGVIRRGGATCSDAELGPDVSRRPSGCSTTALSSGTVDADPQPADRDSARVDARRSDGSRSACRPPATWPWPPRTHRFAPGVVEASAIFCSTPVCHSAPRSAAAGGLGDGSLDRPADRPPAPVARTRGPSEPRLVPVRRHSNTRSAPSCDAIERPRAPLTVGVGKERSTRQIEPYEHHWAYGTAEDRHGR